MPEEQEERMLRITGTMVKEFGKWADDNGPMPEWVWCLCCNEFWKLEPVPEPQEHSDEDYYGALAVQDEIRLDLSMAELRIIELEADYANLINHTDPDYVIGLQHRIKELEAMLKDETEKCIQDRADSAEEMNKMARRIGELEVQADNCPVCGTVRRVEELRAKEHAKVVHKKPRRFPELDKIVPQNIDDKPEG